MVKHVLSLILLNKGQRNTSKQRQALKNVGYQVRGKAFFRILTFFGMSSCSTIHNSGNLDVSIWRGYVTYFTQSWGEAGNREAVTVHHVSYITTSLSTASIHTHVHVTGVNKYKRLLFTQNISPFLISSNTPRIILQDNRALEVFFGTIIVLKN